jgi:hypothetical protein
MLGHSDIRMTLAIYPHATDGMQDAAIAALEEALPYPAVDALLTKGPGSYTEALYFSLVCRTFLSGGTRIRTGDTMIFRFVPKPTVNPRRVPRAESKRFLQVADRRGPPPNAMDRHAEVVELWWAQRVLDRLCREQDTSA